MPRAPSAAAEDYSGLGLCLGGSEERQQPRPLHRIAHTLGPWLQSRPCSLGLASGWGAHVLGWHSLTSAGGGEQQVIGLAFRAAATQVALRDPHGQGLCTGHSCLSHVFRSILEASCAGSAQCGLGSLDIAQVQAAGELGSHQCPPHSYCCQRYPLSCCISSPEPQHCAFPGAPQPCALVHRALCKARLVTRVRDGHSPLSVGRTRVWGGVVRKRAHSRPGQIWSPGKKGIG